MLSVSHAATRGSVCDRPDDVGLCYGFKDTHTHKHTHKHTLHPTHKCNVTCDCTHCIAPIGQELLHAVSVFASFCAMKKQSHKIPARANCAFLITGEPFKVLDSSLKGSPVMSTVLQEAHVLLIGPEPSSNWRVSLMNILLAVN